MNRQAALLSTLLFALVILLWSSPPARGAADAAAGPTGNLPAEPARYAAGNAVYRLVPVPVDGAVTLVTQFEFPGVDRQDDIDTVLLAGFAAEEGGVPQHLAVRWRREGWFQRWTLGIDGGPGMIPAALRPGAGPRPGYQTLAADAGGLPRPGHVYETTVSYAPGTGYVAVSVTDLTAGEPVYRQAFQLNPWDGPVYAGAGLVLRSPGGEEAALPPEVTGWRPVLIPVGLRWRVVERPEASGAFAVTHLDRSRPLFLEVDLGRNVSAVAFPGELRAVARAEGPGATVLLASLGGGAGTVNLPIEAERLPAGRLEIALEYVLGGSVLHRDASEFSAGLVRIVAERPQANAETGRLAGALSVWTDGPMGDLPLSGRVAATARSLVEPSSIAFERSLDSTIRFGADHAAAPEPVRIAYDFPLPSDPHRWTIALLAGADAPEGVRVQLEFPPSMRMVTGTSGAIDRLLETVRRQYMEEFLLRGGPPAAVPAPGENGSWADIDYQDRSPSGWKAAAHLDRTLQMARAFAHPQSAQRQSGDLLAAIARALGYWIENRFRNPNWWWNVIWQPQRLGDILLLVGDALPEDVREGALGLARAEVQQYTASGYTGANLVNTEGNRLRLGLVTRDPEMVAHAFEAMTQEARVVSVGSEGIQVDGSFHQHGALLHSGSYGEVFAGDLVRFARVAGGTALFPPDALSVLVDYILDQQWTVRGRTLDFSTTGRALSRQQASGNAATLAGQVQTLAALPGVPRKHELDAFLARLSGGGSPLVGNRYFWTSDFMVHHRPEFYVSVKASSTRTFATEIGNNENLKGHHLGDGVMYIMRTGTEYDQTFPVWNWEQLPGTTVRHMDHRLLVDGSWLAVRGAGDPAGGVSDGMYGAIAMHLERDGLSARKAWFFFDREVVALGADIRGPAGAKVTTAVNQARLSGSVIVGKGGEASVLPEGGPVALEGPEWVYHDGVTYVFPERAAVTAEAAMRTGRWSDINSVYSSQMLSVPVFSLWLEHSGAGSGGAPDRYAYIVAPGVLESEVPAYANEHGIAVVANGRGAQAVWHTGLGQLQAVFWQAGSVTAPSGLAVSVDGPALVIVRESEGEYIVTAGVLERVAGTVTVRLGRAAAGESGAKSGAASGTDEDEAAAPEVFEVAFTFPEGDYLGRSITQVLRPAPLGR